MAPRPSVERTLEWLVVWVLATSLIGLVSALAGHFLPLQVVVLALLVTSLYIWRSKAAGATSCGTASKWSHVGLIILVGIFFRVPAYNYVLGGQDEGVYVNMAHFINNSEGIAPTDGPLKRLQHASAKVRDIYLKENHPGLYVPGVYTPAPAGAHLEFQFYHLFPVWMALFAGVLGSAAAVYALTFFALLSLIFFYRLATQVSGSTTVGLVAGILLAVNPMHAFFSKFPVTEVMALTFSVIGFGYLATYWKASVTKRRWGWLAISALCFGALFATRISGFMYMPFVIALAMASSVLLVDRALARAIVCWAVGVVGIYAVSVAYGLHWSGIYARAIYQISFTDVFGGVWKVALPVFVACVLAIWMAVTWLSASPIWRQRLATFAVRPIRRLVGPVILLGLCAGAVKVYQLGWTQHYAGDPWLGLRWRLSGTHWQAVQAASVSELLVYLGPLVPLAFLAYAVRPKAEGPMEFLRVFVGGFLVYAAVLQWIVPYGPYYTRYLLSELLPYMLLFVVLVWGTLSNGRAKHVLAALLIVTGLYCSWAATAQLGKEENAGSYAQLSRLVANVGPDDLLMIGKFGMSYPNIGELKTPLVYTFRKNVVTLTTKSLDDRAYVNTLASHYDDAYLVSPKDVAPHGFTMVRSVRVRTTAFKRSHMFPSQLIVRGNIRLYLYRMTSRALAVGEEAAFSGSRLLRRWTVSGWSSPESWGIWTLGHHAELRIPRRVLPHVPKGKQLVLRFKGNALVNAAHPMQRFDVEVNGKMASTHSVRYPGTSFDFEVVIPVSGGGDDRTPVSIAFSLPDAATPRSLGINGDGRVLALGFRSVSVTLVGKKPAQ